MKIHANKKSFFGRTMIEMLSVLAIIGVLSVGSLVAYEYAMDSQSANIIVAYVNSVMTNAQLRNQNYGSINAAGNVASSLECGTILPLTQAEQPEEIESCRLVTKKGGYVWVGLYYTMDTSERLVNLVSVRQPRKIRSSYQLNENTNKYEGVFELGASAQSN